MGLNLFSFLMPRQESFVPLFCEHWKTVCQAAQALGRMVDAPATTAAETAQIRQFESEADRIARSIFVAANRTFNAPIDREDILSLTHLLDDVIDQIDDTAKMIERFALADFPPDVAAMVAAVGEACGLIGEALPLLERSSRNAQQLFALCERVAQVEGRVDDQFDASLTQLHVASRDGRIDMRTYLDRKQVYEQLEAVVDTCDDVANAIETITVKHV
jgi:uncharacterized protein Yka (UPF0111/DUF47 family)